MRFYTKAVLAYFREIFFSDEEARADPEKRNVFKRYAYYTIDDLMIVDPTTGRYTCYPMPAPFSWPGRLGWRLLDLWQTRGER